MNGLEVEKDTESTEPMKSDNDQHELENTNPLDSDKRKNSMSDVDNNFDSEFGGFGNEDDFGDFDDTNDFGDFDDTNDFGDFDDNHVEESNNTVGELLVHDNPMTLDELFELWSAFVTDMYSFRQTESFTGNNSAKSIKLYVLEEAPNSFHSRITWDSVTKYTDDDTGIPKVRWVNSEIEKLHLQALSCQRSVTPITTAPTMLNISQTNFKESVISTTQQSPVTIAANSTAPEIMKSPTSIKSDTMDTTITTKNAISPTSEKRSSIFGLSSLSRYLPQLSKSKLPSPTSPKTPAFNTSAPTTPRIVVPNHNIVTSPPMNYMNIQKPSKETTSNLKRANTVAFSPNQTAKTRARSATSQSMNLLVDLFDDDITSASNTSPLNFTPLVPTASTSTPHQTRRYTIPANMHSGNKPVISSAAAIKEEDDDFGDFTGEETDIGNNLNAFDIFSTSMVRSKTEPTVDYNSSGSNKAKNNESLNKLNVNQSIIPVTAETSNASSTINDSAYPQITEPLSPTQLESVGNIRQSTPASLSRTASNMNNEDDPYDRASYFRKSTPLSNNSQKGPAVREQLNDTNPKDDPFDLFSSSNSQSSKAIPPASAQFDLLSPVYNQQQTNAKKSISAKQELFDSFMSPPPQANQVKPPEDDEDWGDWAF